jgi:PRTRC genetic system protein E
MFTELLPLLRKRGLIFTISLVEGDTIRATVLPQKATEVDDNAVTTPLAITGIAEELDRDLPQQLVEFVGAHLQLQSTLVAAKAEIEAAAKSAREDARKKSSKPSTATTLSTTSVSSPAATSESPQEPEPSLFATADQHQTPTSDVGCQNK